MSCSLLCPMQSSSSPLCAFESDSNWIPREGLQLPTCCLCPGGVGGLPDLVGPRASVQNGSQSMLLGEDCFSCHHGTNGQRICSPLLSRKITVDPARFTGAPWTKAVRPSRASGSLQLQKLRGSAVNGEIRAPASFNRQRQMTTHLQDLATEGREAKLYTLRRDYI